MMFNGWFGRNGGVKDGSGDWGYGWGEGTPESQVASPSDMIGMGDAILMPGTDPVAGDGRFYRLSVLVRLGHRDRI